MDNKYKRLLHNSIWTLAGNTGSKVLSFLLLPLYTRWLGTAGFGESDLVTTYSSFLVCIMTLCVSDAIFVFTKNQNKETKDEYYSSSLFFILLVLAFWMIIWFILGRCFSYFHVENSFSNNLWYIYGIVVTTFLQQYTQQFILSLEKIKIYSFTGIIHTLMTFLMSLMLIPSYGVRGYIFSMIFSNLVTALYSFCFSGSYNFISFSRVKIVTIRDVLKYSIPLIPNAIMWWLVSALNRPVMEHHLDYSSIGIFAVANRFPAVIIMVFSVFSVSWNISVFEEYKSKDFEQFYSKTFKLLFSCITAISSAIILFSDVIIKLFASSDFKDASLYMPVLIIGALFSCYSAFFGTCFSVERKSKYFFYSSLWGAITAVVLNAILIPCWGVWGTCVSTVLSFFSMFISRYFYSLKFVKAKLLSRSLLYGVVLLFGTGVSIYIESYFVRALAFGIVVMLLYLLDGRLLLARLKKC